MLQLGVKVKFIQDYLKTNAQHTITARDLHNIRHKMKCTETDGKSEEELMLQELTILGNSHNHPVGGHIYYI